MRIYFLLFVLFIGLINAIGQSAKLEKYKADLKSYGQDPVEFVRRTLDQHDLLVFDDALHSAYEPFVFYNQLINTESLNGKLNFIFLEVINTTAQPLIDSFLNAKSKDSTILSKVFQDDYTGLGWRYQTYLDLFNTVWEHNQGKPDSSQIHIIGVNQPIYWDAIHTWKDYELFQNTLASRDYFMYLEILKDMQNFKKGKKGFFLCNTRHAYKNIQNSEHQLYWNTTTFFSQRNPGKVFSIRIHNATLSLESFKKTGAERKSTDGLNEIVYKWIKMDNGLWDSAFADNENKPVAIALEETAFGKTTYVGNHMLNIVQGTKMSDAYDALIFLAPLDKLHFSAQVSYIYTQQFKPELERRIRLLKGNDFDKFLKENNSSTFDEFFNANSKFIPITQNTFLKE